MGVKVGVQCLFVIASSALYLSGSKSEREVNSIIFKETFLFPSDILKKNIYMSVCLKIISSNQENQMDIKGCGSFI